MRLSLRQRLVAYLVLLHGMAIAVAIWHADRLGLWFFAVEAAIVVSLLLGLRWVGRALAPLQFVSAFSDVLREREFSSRFSTVGMPEMDALIRTYNRMLETLYQERLRVGEQRGFVERFLQATPVGVLVLDFDGRIALSNPAAAVMLGQAPESLDGRRLRQFDDPLARAVAGLERGRAELVRAGSGRRFRIERDAFIDRGFERDFIVLEEVTAILNESERAAYRKLVRLMSHEVNNTVASTNSLLQSCRNFAPQLEASDRSDYLDALDVVMRRNDHLGAFMRELARVVKLPAPELAPTHLDELLRELEPMFRAGCVERGIRWRMVLAPESPPVAADSDQLEQALLNIVKNAMEAAPAGGEVCVELAVKSDAVTLEIRDDGPGIPPSAEADLFTPFYTSKPGGQGLGLTLVKEILLQHAFRFSLRSHDGWTVFRIEVPVGA